MAGRKRERERRVWNNGREREQGRRQLVVGPNNGNKM
jgi:hypothetical protein